MRDNLNDFTAVIDRFNNGEITFQESIGLMTTLCGECQAELADIGLEGASLSDVQAEQAA